MLYRHYHKGESIPGSVDKKSSKGLLHSFSHSARKLIPLPFLKADPDPDEDLLRVSRRYDDESNKKTTPAESEVIDLCCIWAVEFYTPSHIDSLLSGVKRFGWKQEGFRSLRDIEEWVDDSGKVSPGVRGSWLNLGFVSSSDYPFVGPSGTNNMTRNQVHPDALPPNYVTKLHGDLISITSSLSCVIMCFILDNDYAKKIDAAIRADRQTDHKVTSQGRTVLDPGRQKFDDIKQVRREIKATATNWFSANIPGLFSSGLLEGEMPTYELVTLRDTEPFPSERHLTPYFLRTLGLEFSYDAWASTEIPGLKLSLHDWVDRGLQYHSIFSMRESDLSDDFLKRKINWAGRDARIFYVDEFLRDKWLLHLSALLLMLEGYGNHLRAVRESSILRPDSRPNSVGVLNKLASNVSFSIDTDAVTSELQAFAEPESWVRLPLSTFEPVEPRLYPEGYTLADSLCSAIAKHASWIQKMDSSLRDHGTQYGALVGAMENVRIQEKISFFTCVLVVLTIVLTIVTIFLMALTIILGLETLEKLFPISKFFEWLQSVWEMLQVLY